MKAREADILIHPGLFGGAPGNWYNRWTARLATAETIEQDFSNPDLEMWTANVLAAVHLAKRPVVLIGHSAGALTLVHAARHLADGPVKAAFLVAPPDFENGAASLAGAQNFLPVPRDPLPFPSILVASRDDPYCDVAVAEDWANAWGSLFIDAGNSGHLNDDSGHGPWPEGLMVFARMMSRL
ncbi:alpha/beta hydrolase [Afifella sp. IM 167]|uniref:RBBP9/YdeN family alpha/beta hydrolase n=1 Tax=Afifella sp. IM 167 TaxID=2033586 RepID=UPI001CC9D3DB|nr:alpha/beta hydrolase [Afifella sp. IM 167]MBZ8134688.1 alpha/beta hydrolase [Afifella sp. IM 167]